MRRTIVKERYDAHGNLIERTVETETTYEAMPPAYVPVPWVPAYPYYPYSPYTKSAAEHRQIQEPS